MNAGTRSRIVLTLSLAVLAVTCAFAGDENDKPQKAELGKEVPGFTLKDTKAQERSLSDYEGKIVILEWTEPKCPYVVRQYRDKSMLETYTKVRELDHQAVWLAISSTNGVEAKRLKMWIDQHKIRYPILLDPDGTVGRKYDARTTPHMFVIDTEGVLRYHGAIDDNRLGTAPKEDVTNYVVQAVRQIVEEEDVSVTYMKPYGCSVKYKRR